MKKATRVCLVTCLLVLFVSACSSLRKAFPDRRNDYKSSTEIPPLEIPPDLTASALEDPSIQPEDESDSTSFSEYVDRKSADNTGEASPAVASELVTSGAESSYVQVDESFPKAWRMVGKALNNSEIEIIDRNRSVGIYYVLFQAQDDPEEEPGILASLAFWRDIGIKDRQSEYRIKLEEAGNSTRVVVLNKDGKPQSQGSGLRLLRMIDEKLNGK